MANLAKLLAEIVKRSGVNTEDRKTIKAALEDTNISKIEINDEDYEELMSNIHNLETAENVLKPTIEKRVKAEALNGFDAQILEIIGEGLSDDVLATIKSEKLTPSKLRKAFEAQKSELTSKLKKAGKESDSDTEMILKSEIQTLNNSIKALKEGYEAEKAQLIASHKESEFNNKLDVLLASRTDIAKEHKSSRHFAENFKKDLNDFFKTSGIEYNFENNELVKSDTKTPYLTKTHDKVNLDWALTNVVKNYGYEKKSETPEPVKIEVPKDGLNTIQGAVQAVMQKNRAVLNN